MPRSGYLVIASIVMFITAYCREVRAERPLKIALPTVSYVTIYPQDYQPPHTRRGWEEVAASQMYRSELNSTGFVILPPGKMLSLFADQSEFGVANIKSFGNVPDDRLRALRLHFRALPANSYRELARFTNLTSLDLILEDKNSSVDIDALCAACPQLISFSVLLAAPLDSGAQSELFSDFTFKQICKFKHLKAFSINGRDISDDAIVNIKTMDSLEVLQMSHCKFISDAGLSDLAEMKSLSELGIQFNRKMSVAGLVTLSALPHLKLLTIYGGKDASEAIERLKRDLPSCRIEVE